jgi:hypothetical protein
VTEASAVDPVHYEVNIKTLFRVRDQQGDEMGSTSIRAKSQAASLYILAKLRLWRTIRDDPVGSVSEFEPVASQVSDRVWSTDDAAVHSGFSGG